MAHTTSQTPTRMFRVFLTVLVLTTGLIAAGTGRKFYPDDPLPRDVDSQDASGVQARDIDLVYDTLENSFSWPGDRTPNVRAQNVNTVDEVPDSTWFTNRAGARPMTVDELLKGSDATAGPAAGSWHVISAKGDGVTPGFTVRDAAGVVWFLKFDPPGYRGMATGTEVVVSKLFWALGYHVPEVHLASMRAEQLTIDEAATITPPNGNRRRFNRSDIGRLLQSAHRDSDGSYRVIASKALDGRPVGGFRFYGTRSDDPNDVVPHEHRRELRAYATFSAWVNHVDSKSINTFDTVVAQDGQNVVRHYLIDFGSTIGSAGVYPREAFEGTEYLVEGKRTLAGIPTFGLYVKDWRTVPTYRARSVGAFPSDHSTWDPETWKPRYANSAFRSARLDDKFWAARRLQGFTNEMLMALPRVGQFDDPKSEAMLTRFLIDRRNAIVRRYLPAVNPTIDVALTSSGLLTFRNAAVEADLAKVPAEYTVRWLQFDNVTGASTPLGVTTTPGTTTRVAAPANLPTTQGTYVRAEIAATGGPESWGVPVHAYFVRAADGWGLVGFERMPDGNAPRTSERRAAIAARHVASRQP
jgi:hypothetical protein